MPTMFTSATYKRHGNGGHCSLLNGDPRNICWGQVKVIDTFDNESSGEEAYLYACEGHADKIKYGYRAKYIKEGKHGDADA